MSGLLDPAAVDTFAPLFVSPRHELKTLLSRKYGDWFDPQWSGRCTDGVACFLKSVVDGFADRIGYKIRKPAAGAGENEIEVSLELTRRERRVFSALETRDEQAILYALGLLHDVNPSVGVRTPMVAESGAARCPRASGSVSVLAAGRAC